MQSFRSFKTKATGATCDQNDLAFQLALCILVFDDLDSRWALVSRALWILETLKVRTVWLLWCWHDSERGCCNCEMGSVIEKFDHKAKR
jgi:hypothetical protein